MAGLNRAELIGHLGADPELRFTQNNRAKLAFRIATTESYKDSNGERKDVTHWHNIVLWGARAEALSKILAKGTQVYVEGRIETRSYEDKDKNKRSITEINARDLQLLGRRDGGGEARPDPTRAPQRPEHDDFGGSASDDDIPF